MTQPTLTLPTLKFARFRFDVSPTADFKLPDFAGSMLRGAFGHALRRLSCMTRQKECSGCPLLATCPYTQVFENSEGQLHTNRYVIEPPESGYRWLKPGETFSFNVVLFGHGLAQLPLILLAWQQALERGLGKGNTPMRLLAVYQNNDTEPFYQPGCQIGPWQPQPLTLPPAPRQTVLRFTTPVYLKQNGIPVRKSSLSPYPLLMAAARRLHMLTCQHPDSIESDIDFKQLASMAEPIKLTESMHWQEWTRYSNRQQQPMQLGGLIGDITLTGNLEPVWPLLVIGQWMHIGKHTSFGLGQYQLVSEPSNANKVTLHRRMA